MGKLLFISEPIDQVQAPGGWKEAVWLASKAAAGAGWIVYRPARAFDLGPTTEPSPELEQVNRAILGTAGALLAFCPAGVPSVGVPREIEFARSARIPALVATDLNTWSLTDVETVGLHDLEGVHGWLASLRPVAGRMLTFTVSDDARLPSRSYPGDAGFDLFVSQAVTIPPGEFVDVPSGLQVALPPGVFGRITGRSSTLRSRSLLVVEGVIDGGYRGPLFSGVFNLGTDPAKVFPGERIAQLILHHNVAAEYAPVQVEHRAFDRLPGDGRGMAGFGSTGA